MSNASQTSLIRDAVIELVSELGVANPTITNTVVLTRGCFYAGYRFFFDGIQAVWLMTDNVVHVYAEDGTLMKTTEIAQHAPVDKAA